MGAFVDHLDLMLPRVGPDSEQEERATGVFRGLKVLARDRRAPVLAHAQLPRGLERRYAKRPLLLDYDPSKPVEEFADVEMFPYQDELCHPDTYDKGVAEVIVAKHCNGPPGEVELAFLESFGRFASIARR